MSINAKYGNICKIAYDLRKMSINGNKCDKMHCMWKMSSLRVYFCIHWTMKIPTKLSTFLYTAIHNACRFRLLPVKNASNFNQKTAEFSKKQPNFKQKVPNLDKKAEFLTKKSANFTKKRRKILIFSLKSPWNMNFLYKFLSIIFSALSNLKNHFLPFR